MSSYRSATQASDPKGKTAESNPVPRLRKNRRQPRQGSDFLA
jgi:hypothetical protein